MAAASARASDIRVVDASCVFTALGRIEYGAAGPVSSAKAEATRSASLALSRRRWDPGPARGIATPPRASRTSAPAGEPASSVLPLVAVSCEGHSEAMPTQPALGLVCGRPASNA